MVDGQRSIERIRSNAHPGPLTTRHPRLLLVYDRQHVVLAQNDELVRTEFDLGAAVFGVVDLVADLDIHRAELAALEQLARPNGDDLSLLRFFLRRIGEQDAAGGL